MKTKTNWLASIGQLAIIGIGIVALLFLASVTWIGSDVAAQCKQAKAKYGGDCVEALSKRLDDNNESYHDRNNAIWALGQMGDARALPMLEKYYTGHIPSREPWNGVVSQYELKKAINLANGGTNISAPFWRWMIK